MSRTAPHAHPVIPANGRSTPARRSSGDPPPPTVEQGPDEPAEGFSRRLVAGGLLAALVLFIIFRAHAVVGDGAVYALTIERSHFFERSIHVAYFVVGWIGTRLMRPFGVPTDEGLILLNGMLMTAALGMAWLFFRALELPRSLTLVASFVLMFAGNVLNEGTNVEIHALELLTVLSSYVLFLRNRPLLAGLVYGCALLVTPLASLASGFFLWDAWRRNRWRPMLVTAAASAVVYGGVLAFCWQEYFFGVRGLLRSGPNRPWTNISYNLFAFAKSFHLAAPFAAIGIYSLGRARHPLLALLAVTLAFHLPAFLGTRDNGILAITCYPVLALTIGAGVMAVLRGLRPPRGRILVETVAALYVVMALYLWLDAPGRSYRETFVQFLRQAPPGSVVVSSWSTLTALEYYAHHYGLHLPAMVNSRVMTRESLRHALATHPRAFAIEALYPNRLSHLLPRSWGEYHYRGQAVIPLVTSMLPMRYESIAGPEPLVVRLEPLAAAATR